MIYDRLQPYAIEAKENFEAVYQDYFFYHVFRDPIEDYKDFLSNLEVEYFLHLISIHVPVGECFTFMLFSS